ncbi:MAG: phosphatidate cytidylyltransferase, partial [Mycobacterium sp.]
MTPMTDTPVEEPPKKTPRAGRDLPAAIGVGVVLGAIAIGVLLFAPIGWLPMLAVAIPIATYEVVRRLGEAGYALPVIPLLVGGQAMIWLSWPYGVAGTLGAYGGTVVVCMVWRLVGQGFREQPVNYLR